MFNFEEYKKIKKKIDFAGKKTEIIAISKNHLLEDVENAISCGLNVFGENRVQEAKSKFEGIKKRNTKTITTGLDKLSINPKLLLGYLFLNSK